MIFKTKENKLYSEIKDRKPLPLGRREAEEWAARIINLAQIPGATIESQKFALFEMIMHLGPTESHKEDAFFIHSLRKSATNQVVHAMMVEIRDAAKERLVKEETEKLGTQIPDETKILAN